MNLEEEFESFKYDSDKYERKRIKVLKEERELIQTKTYTNWINSVLVKVIAILFFRFDFQIKMSDILRPKKKSKTFSQTYQMERNCWNSWS